MPPEPIIDENYASSEDSDFAPDDAPEQESLESSDDEADATTPTAVAPKKPETAERKRQTRDDIAEAGLENSGDEAIIEKGKKRRKKSKAQARDDEGGEGGLIKTRSMRAIEKAERKVQASSGPVTVDVDALWAQMIAAPVVPLKQRYQSGDKQNTTDFTGVLQNSGHDKQNDPGKGKDNELSQMIKIKRTYNFAGKVHTEEKVVARNSAEAKVYLTSLGENAEGDTTDETQQRRMPKKAFRSIFEPVVIDQSSQRSDLNLGISVRLQAREQAKEAKKLNTVEKSRMDWAGFVDKEGIKDELELAGRSKASFANRQDFLARSEAKREEEARRARIAGRIPV